MQIKKMTLMILLSALTLTGWAQSRSFTLKEAQDYAIKNNQEARNAIIDVAIAAKKVKETIAGGLPQINSSIGYNNFINLATQLIPAEFFGGEPGTYLEVQFGTKHNATVDAQLSQLIFSGSYIVGLKAAKEYENMSKLQLEQVETDVKAAIANAYYLVLISEENKRLMEETVSTMQKLLADTEAMHRQGFIEDTEVDRLKLVVSDLQTALLNAGNQIENARHLLKFNLGLKMSDQITLTDNLETILMAVNPSVVVDKAFSLDEHLSSRMLDQQVTLSELQVRLARSEYLPVVSGFVSQSFSAQRNAFNFFSFDEKWFPTSLAGVQISIPVFSSGTRIHKVRQSELELQKMRNSRDQVQESLLMGAATAKNNFEVAVKTYENKRTNFDLAKKIYGKDQLRYTSGVASGTDLNQSYNTLLEAQGTYLSAIMDLLNKKTELDKAYSQL